MKQLSRWAGRTTSRWLSFVLTAGLGLACLRILLVNYWWVPVLALSVLAALVAAMVWSRHYHRRTGQTAQPTERPTANRAGSTWNGRPSSSWRWP